MNIYELFTLIEGTSGIKKKKEILSQNMSELIEYIFEDTYGPKKYYIKNFEPLDKYGVLTIDNDYIDFHNALNRLHRRELIDTEAYEYLQDTVAKYDELSQNILCRIIDRSLRIGLSYDSYISILYPESIPFEVSHFDDISNYPNVNFVDGTYFISKKVPGIRCICRVKNWEGGTIVIFISKEGEAFPALSNLNKYVEDLVKPLGIGEFIIDGVVSSNDEYMIDNLPRTDYEIANPIYNIFDIMTLSQFDLKVESPNYEWRNKNLQNIYNFNPKKNINIIEQNIIHDEDEFKNYLDEYNDVGCIMRKNAPYCRGYSSDMVSI